MTSPRSALFLLPDIPGHFHRLALELGKVLRSSGVEVVTAITSPYYPRFKGVDLSPLGEVHDLSASPLRHAEDPELDYWSTYSTFVRRSYFSGVSTLDWREFEGASRFFADLFERKGPFGVVWSENISNAFLHIAYGHAQRRGVPFYGYISGRVPGVFNVMLEPEGARMLENPSPVTPAAPDPAGRPDYMANPQNNLSEYSLIGSVGTLARQFVRGLGSGGGASIETGHPLRHQVNAYRHLLARKARHFVSARVERLFESELPPAEGVRVLFPLQFRPESSTSVLARHYADDLEVIRNVAFSLPPRGELVVKEHRSAIGIRSPAFYRAIRELPRTRLLGPEFPLGEHFDAFDAVVTLTSTAGFEALQRNIPVLLLGEPFFRDYPGVQRIESFAALAAAVRQLRRRAPGSGRNAEILERYLRTSFPGTFNYLDPRVCEPANVRRLAAPLLERLTR